MYPLKQRRHERRVREIGEPRHHRMHPEHDPARTRQLPERLRVQPQPQVLRRDPRVDGRVRTEVGNRMPEQVPVVDDLPRRPLEGLVWREADEVTLDGLEQLLVELRGGGQSQVLARVSDDRRKARGRVPLQATCRASRS
jgi:hypothetical protein